MVILHYLVTATTCVKVMVMLVLYQQLRAIYLLWSSDNNICWLAHHLDPD